MRNQFIKLRKYISAGSIDYTKKYEWSSIVDLIGPFYIGVNL